MPKLDIDSQSKPLDIEKSIGQSASRGCRRATPFLRIVACEQAHTAPVPGPGFRLHVITVHSFRENAGASRQKTEAVAVTSCILELEPEQPFIASLHVEPIDRVIEPGGHP